MNDLRKKQKVTAIGGVLCVLGILILVFLKNLSEAQLGGIAVLSASILIISALILFQWEENKYRFDSQSIPGSVKIIFSIVALVLFVWLNKTICEFRLGGVYLLPNIFLALFIQSIIFLIGAGIYLVSYTKETVIINDIKRLLVPILACAAGFIILNFIFYSDIGDLTAQTLPTRRCYPGGSCYDAGNEQWGGTGALLLLSVNLLQGILILNILVGLHLIFKQRMK